MLKSSPKTTLLGVATCLLSLASVIIGAPISIDVIANLAAGVGLVLAKDHTS